MTRAREESAVRGTGVPRALAVGNRIWWPSTLAKSQQPATVRTSTSRAANEVDTRTAARP
jgi:hypothetical protein